MTQGLTLLIPTRKALFYVNADKSDLIHGAIPEKLHAQAIRCYPEHSPTNSDVNIDDLHPAVIGSISLMDGHL